PKHLHGFWQNAQYLDGAPFAFYRIFRLPGFYYMASSPEALSFDGFTISAPILQAIKQVGYETPTQIQARAIPHLLAGCDLVGQAQTGTGKTAAFAIPILNRLALTQKEPQALVLVPTRELAIQVAEAFQTYAR